MENNTTNKLFGQQGEDLAADFLLKKGYEIKERNWRSGRVEIDIIAVYDSVLHFVEVKSRSREDSITPEAKVNQPKLSHMKQVAEAYLVLNNEWKFIQFDIISIILTPGREPYIFIIEDVF